MSLDNWSPHTPDWIAAERALLPATTPKSEPVLLSTLLEKSENFPIKFPIDANRCKKLKSTIALTTLERNINSSYPIVHENILQLYAQFILHKRKYGNRVEKEVYKDMDLIQFVDRLLCKRAANFMGKKDIYILLNGKKGTGNWESIGSLEEKAPLLLKDCLSYEEIKLAAFLSVSSYTYFMNIGDRKNLGYPETYRKKVQNEGIIVGIIGPRLVKEEVMEYQELVITEKQNTKKNGYGDVKPPTIHHLFAKLYDEECLDYEEIIEKKNKSPKQEQRYTDLEKGEILDNFLYFKRLVFTMDLLFMEANSRALEKQTTAYVHVVGIGLGVWQKSPIQNKIFMDSCGHRIKSLGKHLHNVSDICFSWINHDRCLNYKNGDIVPIDGHPLQGIRIHINKRDPHAKLWGADEGKLLVVSYAWDGNALPGNEFWKGKLGSSGDSAAASSTQIAELHNPFINPKVCAANLKVVVADGVLGVGEYAEMVKRNKNRSLEEEDE